MIRNTVVNTVNYFYPLGNTPAVSLTQDLPPETDADVLLLGCGDARNILFTCFVDPGRSLDVTCCDIEAAVLARNILLYTLLIDDANHDSDSCVWNIYYHWKLDQKSTDRLQRQLQKLTRLSEALTIWKDSCYGDSIRFCDERTFTKVRSFWQTCKVAQLTTLEKSQRESQLQKNISKAIKIRGDKLGEGLSIDGMRSAAPAGIMVFMFFPSIGEQWWQEGVTKTDGEKHRAINLNPTFLLPTNDNITLHYGTNPLLGFPLAAAYVPLSVESPLHVRGKGSTSSNLVQCARNQFRAWAKALRCSVSQQKLILRFCLADALAFSWSLQCAVSQRDGTLSANIACDNWTSTPLLLHESEYGNTNARRAPRRFDIIDTSNLIDHLGPLNLIPAMTGLLKQKVHSTVYTEALVQHDSTERERITTLLGGDIRTVGLLFGLSPCEVWTNATTSPEDDSVAAILGQTLSVGKIGQTTQTRSRLRWKATISSDMDGIRHVLLLNSDQVVHLLYKLYGHMFQHENLRSLFSSLNMTAMNKRSLPSYNRTGVALLIKQIQNTIETDWQKCSEELLYRIFSGFSDSPIGGNFAQELMLSMHMFNINTSQLPKVRSNTDSGAKLYNFFKTWPEIPTQVCVTLRVPRKKLAVFTSKSGTVIGTPVLRCDIEDINASPRPWSNSFTSVQLAFGQPKKSQAEGLPVLTILEDGATWWGKADMFISTFVPAWMLLQSGQATPVVKCGILGTPQSTIFVKDLGMSLDLFKANLISEDVVISRFMPSMPGLPRYMTMERHETSRSKHILTASLDADGTTIATLSRKTLYHETTERMALQNRSIPVQIQFKTPWCALIKIGDKISSAIHFPVPVDQTRRKVRIARQSCYVEIEAPLMNPLSEAAARFIYPVLLSTNSTNQFTITPWTAARMNLDLMPIMDLKEQSKLNWLTPHASAMFSTRERGIREAGMANQLPPAGKPDTRTEIKEGLFSMFMSYSGLQGHKAQVFALTKQSVGVSLIIIPSCCRLDLVSRTVVLDAAVIPLLNEMSQLSQVQTFYQSLTTHKFLQIKVSEEELECWKITLPAIVERCRIWRHKPDCEYVKKQEAPIIKGLEDGYSPICSCGVGKFPDAYLQNLKINGLDYVLKRYATRAAISPIFALPYVEDCFLAGLPLPKSPELGSAPQQGCKKCGGSKRKDSGPDARKLLVCGRCKQVKYCSAACQKADWKEHKALCTNK